ncbi:UNVERIFIED_CONTAM: hypothetical protein K2H54_051795 [Gekko kuhli]
MEPYKKKTELEFLRYKVYEYLEEIKELKEKLESREREYRQLKKKLELRWSKEMDLVIENKNLFAILQRQGKDPDKERVDFKALCFGKRALARENQNILVILKSPLGSWISCEEMERDKKQKEMNILRSQLTMYVEAHDELEEKLERWSHIKKEQKSNSSDTRSLRIWRR